MNTLLPITRVIRRRGQGRNIARTNLADLPGSPATFGGRGDGDAGVNLPCCRVFNGPDSFFEIAHQASCHAHRSCEGVRGFFIIGLAIQNGFRIFYTAVTGLHAGPGCRIPRRTFVGAIRSDGALDLGVQTKRAVGLAFSRNQNCRSGGFLRAAKG